MDASEVVHLLEQVCTRYNQGEVAQFLGRNPKTISRWRTGHTSPPPYLRPALQTLLVREPVAPPQQHFTFIDLFAGIGGIRIGFESSGGRCVFTSEWNAFSQKTYRENFVDDHDIVGDIVKVNAGDIPDHDVLLAGFPCQPFSIAGVSKKNALGRPHGFECATQGTLFFDVARIIAEKRPAAFVLENVKNLRSHDKGNTFRVVMDVLQKELGYQVQWRIIDGRRFVPQHRERILIVGFREETGFDFDNVQLPAVETAPRLRSILHAEDGSEADVDRGRYIGADGKVDARYVLTPRLWQYLQDYAAKHRAKGNGFGFGLVSGDAVARTLSARYYKDGSEVLVSRGDGERPRRLTPRECARLMGFPDTFRIPVSDTQAYKQFGNSVVVPAISAVAQAMRPHIVASRELVESRRTQRELFAA